MRFHLEQEFRLPLQDVEDAYVDPEFIERLAELPKLGHPELLDQQREGAVVRQRVRYRFEGELSSAVTRVIDPKRLTWVEESTLDRRLHRTTFVIRPDHYGNRLESSGTFTLYGNGTGTRRVAEGEVRVHVPFVGGKVERAIVSGLSEHAEREVELLHGWLGRTAR